MPNRIIQYPVALMLKKVLKDKSSGELTVVGRDFTKALFFIEGSLAFAKTTLIEERLGEVLFKIGKIDRPQFVDIKRLIRENSGRLGSILVQKEVLNERDLFFALIYQMRTIATSTFRLVSGEWNFITKTPDLPRDSRFNIHLPSLITEGCNKMGNVSYFKNKFYYKSPRLLTVPPEINDVLSTQDLNFIKEVGRFNNSTNQHISSSMNVSEEVFWKKVAMFFLLNLVEFVDVTVDKERDENIESMMRLHEQLKANRMDFYQLLGLDNTATFNEIKGAYFTFAKKYHPDRISSAPDPEIKEKANFVFAEINKAYETLSNEEKKREYDTRGYKENTNLDTIQENLAEKARILYRKGKGLYGMKKYWEAASVLDEAVG
ncbi:MAG: J domain-containing protein, partial [bacterium]|nr:J domain-containing protein [bacterium]